MAQRDTNATLAWYRRYDTNPPFDPDGMCLKICRTARNIGPMYPSAISAQVATPDRFRVQRVRDVRRGMVMFFDDPHDSNPYGHIVTVAGRAKGVDPRHLRSLIVWTNSVRTNQIVAVRADYFPRHWGDEFQFAATWLNGVRLDLPNPPRPPHLGSTFQHAIEDLQRSRDWHKRHGHTRIVNALNRDIEELRQSKNAING